MDDGEGLQRYRVLIRQFVAGELSASEFERQYIATRRQLAQRGFYPEGAIGEVLDELFGDVDAFTNLEPRRSDELDAEALRDHASAAQSRLDELLGPP